jgi:ATP-dependent protease ClpP protease subunit
VNVRDLLPPDVALAYRRGPAADGRTWYNMRDDGERTIVDLYDEIGAWGIPAAEFVRELRAVDTPVIELHINSPGGMIYDGLTIYNALMDHPARVEAVVDGIAASAASWILQSAELRSMNRHTELFIHDGLALTIGNEQDHLDTAADLGRLSTTIAEIYTGRAGGTVDDWRAAMRAETTYPAHDAVNVGLADEVIGEEPPDNRLTERARARADLLERIS